MDSIALLCYPTVGGSGRVATELAGIFARRGFRTHLLSYERPVRLDRAVHFHRVHVTDYPLLRYPPYDQALATTIVDLHVSYGVELFHAHYALPHALAVLLADQMLGGGRLRLVTTLHGTDITLVGGNPAYRRTLLYGLEKSLLVTAVSRSLADDTRAILGFQGPIEVVPNFVDLAAFKPGTAKRWIARDRHVKRRLVHISTFRPVKRVHDLLRAVACLKKRLPVQLCLVGDGPQRASVEELSLRLGMQGDVDFVGEQDDPSPWLRDADLYIFSSRNESFGLGVLEALACAVPVVGPQVGGVPEVLGCPPAGRLTAATDPLALADAATSLLSDAELYRELAKRARERAVATYPPDLVADLYLEHYRRVMAGKLGANP